MQDGDVSRLSEEKEVFVCTPVWLRWSSEWGGDRVEEGVPGTQKARR